MNHRSKTVVLLLAAVSLLLSLSVTSAPTAEAQAPVVYDAPFNVGPGGACPAGTAFIGTVDASPFPASIDGNYCQQHGFSPIQSEPSCLASPGGVWFGVAGGAGTCAIGGWSAPPSPASGADCQAPFVFGFGTAPGAPGPANWCLIQLYSNEGGALITSAGAPVCIESQFVMDYAGDGQVGTQFEAGGQRYLIHYGPPTCKVNCEDGFDFNCDGKLGDYCPVELDLNTVAGVKACIDAMATPEVVVEAVDVVHEVDAYPVGAAGGGGGLAHTGSTSSVLVFAGAGLVAFGALSMGVRRKLG